MLLIASKRYDDPTYQSLKLTLHILTVTNNFLLVNKTDTQISSLSYDVYSKNSVDKILEKKRHI